MRAADEIEAVATQGSAAWKQAVRAADILAVDAMGIRVRARAGPARDRWIAGLEALFPASEPIKRVAATVPLERLTGCLDLEASLAQGRGVLSPSVLCEADGGLLLLAMAERAQPPLAAVLGQAIDRGVLAIEREGVSAVVPARIAVVALDEGADEDEAVPASLADRLGLSIDLAGIAIRDMGSDPSPRSVIEAARRVLPLVEVSDERRDAIVALCAHVSLRRSLFLLRAARALAALAGRTAITDPDILEAAGLVFGHVMRLDEATGEDDRSVSPELSGEEQPLPRQTGAADRADTAEGSASTDAGADMIVRAVQARLPSGLLAPSDIRRIERVGSGAGGKPSGSLKPGMRGRPIGIRQRASPGARLNILATLTAAAPWQAFRAAVPSEPADERRRLIIRKSDFRYTHFREPSETLAVFAVDASGSSALERLGEAKGAIELLLAECYVRRDQVALVAFGGRGAELILAPTRSLVRAKRALSVLPGGGGTPLATGLKLAHDVAAKASGRGQASLTVVLTDGRANIALDGRAERREAGEDAHRMAQGFKASGLRTLLIDTARRPQDAARTLARSMGGEYLALPHGRAEALSAAVSLRLGGHGNGSDAR